MSSRAYADGGVLVPNEHELAQLADTAGLIAWMLIVLIIGIVVDSLGFGVLERAVRRRRGLLT